MKRTKPPFSRRQWLASASTVATAAGASILTLEARAAEPDKTIASGSPGARLYDIHDFGAKGDGKTLDTAALQAAIDACAGDQGGTVLVPAGTFAIGTTELRSNVTLHLAAGATLLGVADAKQYYAAEKIPLEGDSTLADGNVGLLFAVNAENVTVEGPGRIDGQGAQFRSPTRGAPSPAGLTGSHRPYHLLFHRCTHLTVREVPKVAGEYYTMGVPPAYALFARNVRGLTLDNVRFELAAPDARPAVVLDHVSDAAISGLSVQGDPGAESPLRFIESQDVLLAAPRLLKSTAVFLQVEGVANAGITIDGGDISKAATAVVFQNGASAKAVKLRE